MEMLWIFLIILAVLIALWLFMIAPSLRRPAALKALQQHRYAHRGLHNIKKGVPENSMLAFRLAMEQGFGIELDVHLSRDGLLVVEHDDTLKRTCSSNLTIEKSDWAALSALRLEGTEERLPLLTDVFALIDGRVPLLIEMKAVGGNHARLAAALYEALKTYTGPYCVESFEPRTLLWFRQNAPEVPRGQLAGHLRRKPPRQHPVIHFVLYNLLVNVLSRPHFIAYNLKDRRNLSFRVCRGLFHAPVFFWTLKSVEQENLSDDLRAAPIFERIED